MSKDARRSMIVIGVALVATVLTAIIGQLAG